MITKNENITKLYNRESDEFYPIVEFGEDDLLLRVAYPEPNILGITDITVMTYKISYKDLADHLKPFLKG